jgi:ABC-type multidrug transport system permease subunit
MQPLDSSPRARRRYPLSQLILARLREFSREPAAIFWVYVFPIIMMTALGVAFRNKPVETATVLIEESPAAESVLAALRPDERFRARIADPAECRRLLRIGKADLVIAAQNSSETAYHYYFDPTRPGSVLARNAADDVLQRAAGRKDVVASHTHEVSEPGARYIDFLVPGLLGVGIMGGGLWGVGFAVVDMRIRKLLKRFLATPMKRSDFLAAMMVSRFLFTVPEIVILLLAARFFFHVANHGSYLALAVVIVLGTFEFAGIGLLVACRAKTLETVSGLMNLVMLPMWMASGIFFSYERFPEAVQPVIRYLPLTPVIDSLRAIMLEGASLASLWLPMVVIALYAVVSFTLALRWFRWN